MKVIRRNTIGILLLLSIVLLLVPTVVALNLSTGDSLERRDTPVAGLPKCFHLLQQELAQVNTAPATPTATVEKRSGREQSEPMRSDTVMMSFEYVPVSEPERQESGVNLYQLEDSQVVRCEIYMGMKPTTGYDLTIVNVTQEEDQVTIHAAYKKPSSLLTQEQTPTYPHDAVEFELDPGTYKVNIQLSTFETATKEFTVESM